MSNNSAEDIPRYQQYQYDPPGYLPSMPSSYGGGGMAPSPQQQYEPRGYHPNMPNYGGENIAPYQQYQYYPHSYYPAMYSNEETSGAQQPQAEPPKSVEASSAQDIIRVAYSNNMLTEPNSTLYYCIWQPCQSQSKAFKRKADLERHIVAIHTRATAEMIDCEHPTCHRRGEYGFLRKDKMIEHMRDVHKTNIPKRGQKN
jgi:hypothetical protein